MTRPTARHTRLADRLLAPDEHQERGRVACSHIVARYDAIVREMDARWGVDRLPGLLPVDPPPHVPPERHADYRALPSKLGRAVEELMRAIEAADPEACDLWTGRAVAVLRAFDHHVTAAGIQPPPVVALHAEIDGTRYVVIQDEADAERAEVLHPGARVLTALQCAVAVERTRAGLGLLGEARRMFPNAELTADGAKALAHAPAPGGEWDERLGDRIPF